MSTKKSSWDYNQKTGIMMVPRKAFDLNAHHRKSKSAIYINVKKGKNKTQPWTFDIDMPGAIQSTKVPERYSCKKAAIRGALRKMGLWDGRTTGTWNTVVGWKNYVVYTNIITK